MHAHAVTSTAYNVCLWMNFDAIIRFACVLVAF